jgi:hypothetical protein
MEATKYLVNGKLVQILVLPLCRRFCAVDISIPESGMKPLEEGLARI